MQHIHSGPVDETATIAIDAIGTYVWLWKPGQHTEFLYAIDDTRVSRIDSTGTATYYHGYTEYSVNAAGDETFTYYHEVGAQMVAFTTVDVATGEGETTWMFSDIVDSTSATRNESGEVTQARYTPFGEARGTQPQLPTDHTYTGQIEDRTTGLGFYNARYYDPAIGRFVSPDTIIPDPGDGQDFNRYTYVRNNPINLNDPTGNCPTLCSQQDRELVDQIQADFRQQRAVQSQNPTFSYNGSVALPSTGGSTSNDAVASAFVDFVPFVGDVKGVGEAIAGRDVLGNDLAWWERGLGFVGLSEARRIINGADAASDAFRHADNLACLRSFSADTEVLMADGSTVPIGEIEPGDEVWAHDPETGESAARAVLATWPHQDTLLEFTVEGGSITTTEDHHFWNVTDNEWQETQHIDPGDYLLTADGQTVEAGNLDWTTTHYAAAYDLTIDEIHTYFVSAGDQQVLVHNCNVDDLLGSAADFSADELAQLATRHGNEPTRSVPSFEQARAALDTQGVRLRDGLDGIRDPAVRFESDGVAVIINEARPTRSTSFFVD